MKAAKQFGTIPIRKVLGVALGILKSGYELEGQFHRAFVMLMTLGISFQLSKPASLHQSFCRGCGRNVRTLGDRLPILAGHESSPPIRVIGIEPIILQS